LPGLGLGLFVTRSLVEAHGGRIWAESPGRGQGSRFVVVFPSEAQRPNAAPPLDRPEPSRSRHGAIDHGSTI
jgi:K+-sensing histidine kinase KdpD